MCSHQRMPTWPRVAWVIRRSITVGRISRSVLLLVGSSRGSLILPDPPGSVLDCMRYRFFSMVAKTLVND